MSAVEVRRAADVGPQAAQIYEASHAGVGRRCGEPCGGDLLAGGVVGPAAEHVDEEVGDVDAVHRRGQIRIVRQVGFEEVDVGPEDAATARRVADEGAHVDTVGEQGADQAAADHARRTRDEIGRGRGPAAVGAHVRVAPGAVRSLGIADRSTGGKLRRGRCLR